MFRATFGLCRLATSNLIRTIPSVIQHRSISFLPAPIFQRPVLPIKSLSVPATPATAALAPASLQLVRALTKFSLKKGKRKTSKPVLKRFMRLDWGGWIRTRQGRHKKMWKKSGSLKRRLRQHVLVNSTQAWLLDKMVTKFWRRPKYYVNDPYRPYHAREEYFATRKSPIKY